MAKPKIAIIISTTRATRFGEKPAKWIYGIAAERKDMDVELLDLREYPMPFFDEPATNAWVPSKNEVAQQLRWVRAHAKQYHIDPDRIFLIGQSAGGQLVSLAATLGPGPYKPTGGWEDESSDFRAAISVAAEVLTVLLWAAPLVRWPRLRPVSPGPVAP